MKNLFSLKERITALLCVLLLAFVFTGCQDPNNAVIPAAESPSLYAHWHSTYDELFIITESTLSSGGFWGENGSYSALYEGDNLTVVKTDETSGVIYIKYTLAMNPSDVGKWYAVAYKNLTANSVELSGAYKADGKTSTETLEEAKTEFTVANGYFASYSECAKAEVITDAVPC